MPDQQGWVVKIFWRKFKNSLRSNGNKKNKILFGKQRVCHDKPQNLNFGLLGFFLEPNCRCARLFF